VALLLGERKDKYFLYLHNTFFSFFLNSFFGAS